MKRQKQSHRLLFFSFLLVSLLTGLAGISRVPEQVQAAPPMQVLIPSPGDVVISEFRFLGPQGGNDEFIELFNPKNVTLDITGFRIMGSNNSGGTSLRATLGSVTLGPGQYYLLVNSSASAGLLALQDATYSSGITDDGGIALMSAVGTTIIDAVGLSSGSAYKEGTSLPPLSGTANQSYERKIAGEIRNCTDINNNAADFVLNPSSSNPQTFASGFSSPCLVVTGVDSSTPDGSYTTLPSSIDITVSFSGTVYVAGVPTLLLETGVTDRSATYLSGSGTNILTFRYNAVAGDYSTDLDYVSATSLVLNGGGIYDTIGNAILTLPAPPPPSPMGTCSHPQPCSLGENRNIGINIDDGANPRVVSIKRQNPVTTPTKEDVLVFRVTFSEVVTGVDADGSDFAVTGVISPTIAVSSFSGNIYDVTISGGNLVILDGVVGLDVTTPTITDQTGNFLPAGEPTPSTNDETYLVDNTGPAVTVNQAASQLDPTGVTPVNFTVVFSEAIVVSTFTTVDITQAGTAVTWSIANPSGDRRTFTLSATAIAQTSVVLAPSIAAGLVADDAGNLNQASSSTDNSVTFNDITPPRVTVNQQSSGQADPATTLPVRFTVVFTEPINVSTFTPSDITQSIQSGAASGVTWTITDSGDHRTFTLSAITVAVSGNLIPSISGNRVTDVAGNGNLASTSTDNTVKYGPPPTATPSLSRTPTKPRTPTSTRTPTRPPTIAPLPLVAINEFVARPGHDWNGDGVVNTGDEYIELVNHGVINVNLSGYSLDDEANIGSTPHKILEAITIKPGERIVFYGADTGLLLSDGGDGVRLLKPNGQLMDAYNYTTVRYPDQAYCRLPDDGGADDWHTDCFPTPGRKNAQGSFGPVLGEPVDATLCPISDILPLDFVVAECDPFGNNIWRPAYWDDPGWMGEEFLPETNSKWSVFVD